jgi:hypothetical protein
MTDAQSLVEPDDKQPDESAKSSESVRSGGDAEDAPDPREAITGYTQEKPDAGYVGTPAEDDREPPPEDGSSGQDDGSME